MPLTHPVTPFSSHSLDVTSLLQPEPRGIPWIIAQVCLPAFHQAAVLSPLAKAFTPFTPNKMPPPCGQFVPSGQGLAFSWCGVCSADLIIAQVCLPAFHQPAVLTPLTRAFTPNEMPPSCEQFVPSREGFVPSGFLLVWYVQCRGRKGN